MISAGNLAARGPGTGHDFRTGGGDFMRRRQFIKAGGMGLAATAIAAPAIAQSQPELKWRMACSWPKSLDTIFGAAEHFSNRGADATDNKVQIRALAGGDTVPAP